jgi:dCMP deaminase
MRTLAGANTYPRKRKTKYPFRRNEMATCKQHRRRKKLEVIKTLALGLAGLSMCKRGNVGAVIFAWDCSQIYSVGYNGPASGVTNTSCTKKKGDCGCAHAETNAVVKLGAVKDAVMFCTHSPCWRCANAIVNCGKIRLVLWGKRYREDERSEEILRAAEIGSHHADVRGLARLVEKNVI